ncbi:MAG TPA: hypothetical protein VE338_08250 [Ktedonobacterales bacterium]|jgi:plastocyanin|nr:hypothetical protein [Ktedonobacterales bacterium]
MEEVADDTRNASPTQIGAAHVGRLARLLAGLAVAAALMASVAGCSPLLGLPELSNGGAATSSNEVRMGISSFLQQQVTIKAGESVKFVDSAQAGGIHYLCVGQNQRCQPTPGTPAQLANPQGLLFKNGQPPALIQFKTPGVYKVICLIHPGMEVTVVVK